jgi:hypothetical protein
MSKHLRGQVWLCKRYEGHSVHKNSLPERKDIVTIITSKRTDKEEEMTKICQVVYENFGVAVGYGVFEIVCNYVEGIFPRHINHFKVYRPDGSITTYCIMRSEALARAEALAEKMRREVEQAVLQQVSADIVVKKPSGYQPKTKQQRQRELEAKQLAKQRSASASNH